MMWKSSLTYSIVWLHLQFWVNTGVPMPRTGTSTNVLCCFVPADAVTSAHKLQSNAFYDDPLFLSCIKGWTVLQCWSCSFFDAFCILRLQLRSNAL
mmetsp:Transcript_109375/g.265846  ORF Transcript_109375/g.265846 Transcript_109375/m.265846 type:complete len:96 (-) Transcript_109375:32-319(-)